jgi:adenine phosphoribosyltransferase
MSEYKDIEFRAHVDLDDVLNKVTQEAWEIIEAKQDWDLDEMYKEAQDTLVNVVSVAYELWAEIDLEKKYVSEVGFGKLIVDLWNWNTKVQAYRNRYSREKASIEIVSKATNELIADILSFSDPMKNPIEMLESNTQKFLSRTWKYYENIDLKNYIANVPNFPKDWIDFKDISPLLKDREALRNMIFEMAYECRWADVIAGLDARWFLFWEAIANLLNKPFVMIRKAWKLPGETIWIKYGLEYGNDEIEIQKNALQKWQKVALVDDLLATWGTIEAATKLVEKTWATVNNISFAISLDDEELQNMPARQNIWKYKINSVLKYN